MIRLSIMLCAFLLPDLGWSSQDNVARHVDQLTKDVLGVVTSNHTDDRKEDSLKRLFKDNVDMPWIARFVIGRHWRDASNEQKKEYLRLYEAFLMQSYIPMFKDYAGQSVTIEKVSQEKSDQYIAQTKISATDKNPEVIVSYRLHSNKDGKIMIIDIIAEGISLLATQRSDFGSVISQSGVAGLLEMLQEKTR